MNADEFAEIKARHPRDRHDCLNCDEYVCSRGEWDICDAACLVSEVERLQEGLRAILREHRRITETVGRQPQCCTCNPQDKRWPCVTVLEARAALGGEE